MRDNTKEVKICDFGKALGIKDIVEKVEYVRGDHNTKGDEKGDHVIITLKDEKDIITKELEKAFNLNHEDIKVDAYAGDEWIEYRVHFAKDNNPILGDSEIDVIEKFGLRVKGVHSDFVVLEDRKNG